MRVVFRSEARLTPPKPISPREWNLDYWIIQLDRSELPQFWFIRLEMEFGDNNLTCSVILADTQ